MKTILKAITTAVLVFACSCSKEKTDTTDETIVDDISEDGTLDESLPVELQGLKMNLLHDDNFNDQPDFAVSAARTNCRNSGTGGNCDDLPDGWTDFLTADRWHPSEFPDAEAGLQINAMESRGGSGKSMVIWDESYGNPGQWGSDNMLGKRFETGYPDLYAEMWLKYQPEYRWYHLESSNTKGMNYAKLLRITSLDKDAYAFSYGANGNNDVIAIADAVVWANDIDGERIDRTSINSSIRCAPRSNNYNCGEYNGGLRGGKNENIPFSERFGDGQWHKLALRVKMNSAPGVGDGSIMVWIDNELHAEGHDVPYLGADADPNRLFNMVSFGGNMHNYPEPETERFEQWHAIDDIRIYAIEQ